jgi:hypothetical protein
MKCLMVWGDDGFVLINIKVGRIAVYILILWKCFSVAWFKISIVSTSNSS